MKQLASKELYEYWNNLKSGCLAPARNDIDLLAIRRLLANVFILQIDALGRFPLKMCGTRINAYWLGEQKGRSFLEFWDERDRGAILSALSTVTREATPAVVNARSGAGDVARLDLELLLLPLRHMGQTPSFVLGCIAAAREPDWLGRMPAPALTVTSVDALGADDGAKARAAGRTARRPRLVLHEGGRSANIFA